jgi:hypothetical protein
LQLKDVRYADIASKDVAGAESPHSPGVDLHSAPEYQPPSESDFPSLERMRQARQTARAVAKAKLQTSGSKTICGSKSCRNIVPADYVLAQPIHQTPQTPYKPYHHAHHLFSNTF